MLQDHQQALRRALERVFWAAKTRDRPPPLFEQELPPLKPMAPASPVKVDKHRDWHQAHTQEVRHPGAQAATCNPLAANFSDKEHSLRMSCIVLKGFFDPKFEKDLLELRMENAFLVQVI